MLKFNFLLMVVLLVTSCNSVQKIESVDFQTKNYNLEPFTAISVAEGITVELKQSFEHRAKVSSNYTEYVNVEVNKEGVLIIDMDVPHNTTLKKNETTVEVSANNVSKFKASSAANLKVLSTFKDGMQYVVAESAGKVEYNAECEELHVEASSSGDVLGKINVNRLYATASSAGDVSLKGKVKSAFLEASSSGNIEGKKLDADQVNANVSSGGDVYIGVSEYLKAEVSSGGDLYYKANGNIKLDVDKSSGGDVKEGKGIF